MRFIDCLRRDPMCFDGDTNKIDFDASPFLRETTTFDVTEIAAQLIEATHEVLGVGRETIFTETGKDLFKYQWSNIPGSFHRLTTASLNIERQKKNRSIPL